MRVYRSIGDVELHFLLRGEEIKGRYDLSKEAQCSSIKQNAICLFTKKIRWWDSKHSFFLILDIPKEKLTFGKGIYYAAKTFAKTKVWTGRRGKTKYELDEAYVDSYSIENVKAIYLGDKYANWYYNKEIVPYLQKYNLKELKTWDEEIE